MSSILHQISAPERLKVIKGLVLVVVGAWQPRSRMLPVDGNMGVALASPNSEGPASRDAGRCSGDCFRRDRWYFNEKFKLSGACQWCRGGA
jgi:hypothetical protein